MRPKRTRAYDDVAYMIAVALGVPLLIGLAYLMVGIANTVGRAYGWLPALATFGVGIAILTYVTYRAYRALQRSTGR